MTYDELLESKRVRLLPSGAAPVHMPNFLKGFQSHLSDWLIRLGRGAVFADCGLGKGPMAMVFCENGARFTGRPSLIVAPLAVSRQFVSEAAKFGFRIDHTQDGTLRGGINVTNYERLDNFSPDDVGTIALDEASILKNYDGHYRKQITTFMRGCRFASLWSATPAPNDYMEFGGGSEALGVMGRNQMLGTFFTNGGKDTQSWTLKGHARTRFWQWMASWSRAVRRPSDLGFSDDGYVLPELRVVRHVLPGHFRRPGRRITPDRAATLEEQRTENRMTVDARCRHAASLVPRDRQCVVWCHLNPESELLTRLIPGAVEVKGADSDAHKEAALIGFARGDVRVLVTKPKIAGFGMNWQGCRDVIYFPTHSHEAYYQAVRRCWRFGQLNPVTVHLVTTLPNAPVMENMLRKERQSDAMYEGVVREMGRALTASEFDAPHLMKLPLWMR